MREITGTLCRLLAPIIAFTADEAWGYLGHSDSVHLQLFPEPNPAFPGSDATRAVTELLQARETIGRAIEPERQAKRIGSSLEASVALTLPSAGKGFDHDVWNDPATLEEFFILSELHITRDDTATEPTAKVQETEHQKCARCWKHLPDVGTHEEHPALCGRCVEAVG